MNEMLDRITATWAKAWGDGETGAFEDLLAPDYVRQSKDRTEDVAEVKRQIEQQHHAFDDFEVRVVHAIEDDNLVAIHWETTGTHTGDYLGVPPTGKTVRVYGASFIEHRGGLITKEWVVWDPREMLSVIGIWHLGDQRSRRRKEAGNGN